MVFFSQCLSKWTVKGRNVTGCIKDDIPIDDLTPACKYMTKELNFENQLTTKQNKRPSPTADFIVKSIEAPIKLKYKVFEFILPI